LRRNPPGSRDQGATLSPPETEGGRRALVLRRLKRGLRFALGVALLAWVLARSDVVSSVRLLQGSWSLLLLMLVPIFGAAIEAKRLGVLYRALDISLPFVDGYRIVAISTFFNFAVPGGTGGDVAKIYYMVSANRRQRVEAATVVVIDRAVALFAWLLLTLALGGLNHRLVEAHRVLQLMLGVAGLGVVALLGLAYLSSSSIARESRLYGWIVERAPLHRFWARVADALYAYRDHRDAWVSATLWSLVGHFALVFLFLTVARTLLPEADRLDVALLCFIGMLANALPITPGGLGVGEVAFDRLFRLVGQAGGAQLVLAWRIAMLPLGILGGLLYLRGKRPVGGEGAEARVEGQALQ